MKIIITGADGFVGSNVENQLVRKGYSVIGMSRQRDEIDIADSEKWSKVIKLFENANAVIHCAASLRSDETALLSNILGSYNVIQAAKTTGVTKFIYISSVPVIGTPINLFVTEDHLINPKTLYHITKYSVEQMLNLPENKMLNAMTLRITSPIGIGMPRNRLLSRILTSCLCGMPIMVYGNGSRVQNYIDVRDVARAISLSLDCTIANELLLVGGTSISNIDLANLCIKLTNSDTTIKHTEVNDPQENDRWIIDGSKAKNMLGYEPSILLEQSIREIYEDMKCE